MNLPTTTTDKPATVNTRSDAASANEAATAVAGATVSEKPGLDTVPGGSIPAATVPAWKAACQISSCLNGPQWSIKSPTGKFWWSGSHGRWLQDFNPDHGSHLSYVSAEFSLKECNTCPPDWPTPAHSDDPREEPERFCEATGPVVGGTVSTTTSPDGRYSVTSFKPDEPGLHKVPMPVETVTRTGHTPEELAEARNILAGICQDPKGTYSPVETVTHSDPSPCGTFVRKITKPAEPIEKLIDRLAHVRDCHKIDWQFQIRVTGDVEKAEPRSYDTPGYPEHFALHHVYLGEDLTRAILTTIAYDLESKGMDKPTVRNVLESVARAFQLTAEFGETDLIGMAVAVEDKLDIGK